MTYNIIPYSTKYITSLAQLLHSSFHIKTDATEALVQWKYFHPFHAEHTVTYLALDGAHVVGHYTNVPVPLYRSGVIYDAMLCTDMTTSPSHRGKGLISKLAEKVYADVQQMNYVCSFGFSNTDGLAVDKCSRGYGYTIVGPFRRYFKPLVRRKTTPFFLKTIDDFAIGMPAVDSRWRVYKNKEYLTWRYLNKPAHEYLMYAIQNKTDFIGYVVLRFSGLRCYVYDIVTATSDTESMTMIMMSIENEALSRKKRLVIYNVLENQYWKDIFTKAGYFTRNHTASQYSLTVKIHSPQKELSSLLSSDNWLLMGGDII